MNESATTIRLTAREIAERLLPGKKGKVKAYNDGYMMYCPAHNNTDEPSAWIADNSEKGVEGPPGMKCWAGCTYKEMAAALRGHGLWCWDQEKKQKTKWKRDDLIATWFKTWYYKDIDLVTDLDVEFGRVTRMDLFTPDTHEFVKKTFGTKRLKGKEWVDAGPGVHFPIFNKREVRDKSRQGKIIFSVEGEKKCDIMADHGFTAFTTKNGASNEKGFIGAKPEESLKGCKHVVVIPDNDNPGMRAALFKCRHLHKQGIPVKLLVLPELGEIVDSKGKGLDDWFVIQKHTAAELKKHEKACKMWYPEPGDDAEVAPVEDETAPPVVEVLKDNVIAIAPSTDEVDNPLSETALAATFARMYGDIARYVPGHGWIIFTGTHWQWDTCGEVGELLDKTIKRRKRELYKIKGLLGEDIGKWWARFGNLKPKMNVLVLAQKHCKSEREEFDADPFILTCKNGHINLKTGELITPHNKELKCTKIIPWEYKGLECTDHDRWTRFLCESIVFKEPKKVQTPEGEKLQWVPDLETQFALARAMGYSLTGNVSAKKLFLLVGASDAGKSRIGERLQRTLGKGIYAMQRRKNIILVNPQENKYSDFANLAWLRVVVLDEIVSRDVIEDSKVRTATGNDELSCSWVHKDQFQVTPTAKIWVYGNETPKVQFSGNAVTWDRLIVFPFYRTFAKHEQQEDLDEELDREMSGILSWMVRGCIDWIERRGIHPSASMLAAKQEYQHEMDDFMPFVEEFCDTTKPGEKTQFQVVVDVFNYYQKHVLKMSHTWSQKRIAQELELKGFKKEKDPRDKKTYYKGLVIDPMIKWQMSGQTSSERGDR